MPETYLDYLDGLIEVSRNDLTVALDNIFYREAQAEAARLYTLIQLRAEAGEYEPA